MAQSWSTHLQSQSDMQRHLDYVPGHAVLNMHQVPTWLASCACLHTSSLLLLPINSSKQGMPRLQDPPKPEQSRSTQSRLLVTRSHGEALEGGGELGVIPQ